MWRAAKAPLPPPSAPRQAILRGGEPPAQGQFTRTAMLGSKAKSNGICIDGQNISQSFSGRRVVVLRLSLLAVYC